MSEAISLRLASTSSRMWNITSARRERLVARQAGNAALATATAAIDLSSGSQINSRSLRPSRRIPNHPRPPRGPFQEPCPSTQCEIRFISSAFFLIDGKVDTQPQM